MENLCGKSILFFCPTFFDYEKEIKKNLEKLGATVIWFDDRPSNDFFSKVILRLNKNFISSKIEKYYESILNDLIERGQSVDYVFFLNPESINLRSIKKIKRQYSQAEFILYMWDSLKNRRKTHELLPFFDKKFTFDAQDVKPYSMILRPLFFIDTYKSEIISPVYDLLFIGTAHTDRYKFVKKIIAATNSAKLVVYPYFFMSSKILFIAKKIVDSDFRQVVYKDILFKSLKHCDVSNLIAHSSAVLDINHPKQSGLTMRTFETMGSQRKLITTNSDVKNYDFYQESNILVIDRKNPVIDMEFFKKPFVPYSESVLNKYSIEGWLRTIFNLS